MTLVTPMPSASLANDGNMAVEPVRVPILQETLWRCPKRRTGPMSAIEKRPRILTVPPTIFTEKVMLTSAVGVSSRAAVSYSLPKVISRCSCPLHGSTALGMCTDRCSVNNIPWNDHKPALWWPSHEASRFMIEGW